MTLLGHETNGGLHAAGIDTTPTTVAAAIPGMNDDAASPGNGTHRTHPGPINTARDDHGIVTHLTPSPTTAAPDTARQPDHTAGRLAHSGQHDDTGLSHHHTRHTHTSTGTSRVHAHQTARINRFDSPRLRYGTTTIAPTIDGMSLNNITTTNQNRLIPVHELSLIHI